MLGSAARHRVLGSLAILGSLLGFSPVEAGQSAYDDAISRALRLLPRQPEKVELVERAGGPHLHEGKPRTEAFVNHGGRVVYLVRQGVTLQAALKGRGIFDYALATVIWHEMAHIDGADRPRHSRRKSSCGRSSYSRSEWTGLEACSPRAPEKAALTTGRRICWCVRQLLFRGRGGHFDPGGILHSRHQL
jgi:hypothetical protein